MVAISDICGNVNTNCRQTAALVQQLDPDFILAAGDTENSPNATIDDYRNIFDPAWGPLASLMRPVPGNHEYNDPASGPGAEGYRAYFPDDRAPATGPLYYSFDAGSWHFVGLDTEKCQSGENCPTLDQPTDPQFQWMVNDLTTDTHTCDLAYGHHPAFSSPGYVSGGRHGSIGWMVPAWKQMVASGVDLYFSGHDADYERFPAMDGNGQPSPTGTRQFVIGTGGAGKLAFGAILPQSEFRYTGLGATVLTLSDTSYSWQLISTYRSDHRPGWTCPLSLITGLRRSVRQDDRDDSTRFGGSPPRHRRTVRSGSLDGGLHPRRCSRWCGQGGLNPEVLGTAMR